ncbi:MAG TPA: NADH-quinone oxidoreductase subunit H [Capsulimonadaceae bacterium]|jgi:formate hydrogenlyase subunit 4
MTETLRIACLAIIYIAHIAIVPLLLIGIIRTAKARLQGRQGPSPLQPFRDIAKLLRKGETVSTVAFWTFLGAPLVTLAATVAAALMVPWLGIDSPIAGDLLLFIYLLTLAKVVISLSALDTASGFGAIGASREAAVSLFSEPAMLAGLAALAAHAGTTNLNAMLTPGTVTVETSVVAGLTAVGLWMAIMADLNRMPIDDPTTHLELTMIHEAQILDNSGRNLAIVEYTVALRLCLFVGLVGRVAMLALPPVTPVVAYLASLALLCLGAGVIAVSEVGMVRLGWRRIPNLLSFSVAASLLACLLVALKG